jgi:Protein kinase domain
MRQCGVVPDRHYPGYTLDRRHGATVTRKIGSRYTVTRVLGRGTCGTVWEGTGPGGPVAVKLLREDLAADQTLIARFVQERTVLTSLDHPNVVAVRDLVVDGTDLALVMDLVRGRDLRDRLEERGALPPAEAAALTADIAAALAAAHARGVIHRDVKPENVLVDLETGAALLTDFGIARIVDGPRRTRATRIVGTPDYLAPEVIEGCPPGPPVDLYALGTVLFELLTGWTPFGGGHPGAVLRRHVTEAVPEVPEIPQPLRKLLESCLSKAPAARLTAGEAAQRLRAALPELIGLPVLRVPDPRAALDPDAAGAGAGRGIPIAAGAVPLVHASAEGADDSRQTHSNLMRPIREPLGGSLPPFASGPGPEAGAGPRGAAQGPEAPGVPPSRRAGDPAGSEARRGDPRRTEQRGTEQRATGARGPEAPGSAERPAAPRPARRGGRVSAVAAVLATVLVLLGGYLWWQNHEKAGAPIPVGAAIDAAPAGSGAGSHQAATSGLAVAGAKPVGPLRLTAVAALPPPPSPPVGAVHFAAAGATDYVFLTGSDDVIRYAEAPAVGGAWSPWRVLPGADTAADPAVVARPDGRVEVYAVSRSGALRQAVLSAVGAWSSWRALPGAGELNATGTPAAVALDAGRTELIVATRGGALAATDGPDATDGSWDPWHTVDEAGTVKPGVALTVSADGTLAAYVIRAADLAVLRVVYDGSSWDYGYPTGAVGVPEAAYMADGRPYLFVQTITDDVQIYKPGGEGTDLSGSMNWAYLGVTSNNPPGVLEVPGHGLVVAATGANGSVRLYTSGS